MNVEASFGRLSGLPFARMNGIGNAIVVLDLRGSALVVEADEARAIAAAPGLRFDQLMAIHDPLEAGTDAHVRIYNTDGSLSGACGNGTRCVAWFMLRDRDRDDLVLTTATARVICRRQGALSFAVDMGEPTFDWRHIPLRDGDPASLDLAACGAFERPFALGLGNPHAVFFVEDVDAVDLAAVGPGIERSPVFPERANISFAQVVDRAGIKLRVWERGAGITLGCGTGACATLVAAAASGRTGRAATVALPGGRLAIEWRDDGHVIMTGPVELEFEGRLGRDGVGEDKLGEDGRREQAA